MGDSLFARNTVVINTLCPLHIGTGEKLKNFDFIWERDTLIVIDENKLINWITSDQTGKYARELTRVVETNRPIKEFFSSNQLNPIEFSAYALKTTRPGPFKEVLPFIKTAHHQPYLPGSSLKGSIRSALLRGRVLENTSLKNQFAEMVHSKAQSGKSAGGDVDAKVFVPVPVRPSQYSNFDLNRVLMIGDSYPNSTTDLELVEMKVLSVDTDCRSFHFKQTRAGNEMSLFIETMCPKVTIRLPLTWQTHLLQGKGAADELQFKSVRQLMIYLPEFCRAASLQLFQQEIALYQSIGHKQLAGWYEDKRDKLLQAIDEVFFLPIGWGSGYDAKTITDLLGDQIFKTVAEKCRNTQGLGRPGNSPSNQWLGAKFSPKSRKVIVRSENEFEPMGWIVIQFKQASGSEDDWLTAIRETDSGIKPKFDFTSLSNRQSVIPQTHTPLKNVTKPVQTVSKAPTPRAEESPIKTEFTETPQVGDRFKGIVFEVDDRLTLNLLIPGLDDTVAYAVVESKDNNSSKKYRDKDKVICEVIGLEQEKGKTWRINCRCG